MSTAHDGFGHFAEFWTFFGWNNYYLFYSRSSNAQKIIGKLVELHDWKPEVKRQVPWMFVVYFYDMLHGHHTLLEINHDLG